MAIAAGTVTTITVGKERTGPTNPRFNWGFWGAGPAGTDVRKTNHAFATEQEAREENEQASTEFASRASSDGRLDSTKTRTALAVSATLESGNAYDKCFCAEANDVVLLCDGECNGEFCLCCVGLVAVPKEDTWYCPTCATKRAPTLPAVQLTAEEKNKLAVLNESLHTSEALPAKAMDSKIDGDSQSKDLDLPMKYKDEDTCNEQVLQFPTLTKVCQFFGFSRGSHSSANEKLKKACRTKTLFRGFKVHIHGLNISPSKLKKARMAVTLTKDPSASVR